jgi:hypothetical protein
MNYTAASRQTHYLHLVPASFISIAFLLSEFQKSRGPSLFKTIILLGTLENMAEVQSGAFRSAVSGHPADIAHSF